MKRVRNNKGFTLVELMIVLAVISILAVVLAPKAGFVKSTAKDAGVATNVNIVRAFVESKATGSTYPTDTDLQGQLETLVAEEDIANPFTKSSDVPDDTDVAVGTEITEASVVVYDATIEGSPAIGTPPPSVDEGNRGLVFVYAYSNGYAVFGVNNDGEIVNYAVVR